MTDLMLLKGRNSKCLNIFVAEFFRANPDVTLRLATWTIQGSITHRDHYIHHAPKLGPSKPYLACNTQLQADL